MNLFQKKMKIALLAIGCMISTTMLYAQVENSAVFSYDMTSLAKNKSKIKAGNMKLLPAYQHLLEEADKTLNKNKIYTVMEKKQTPPSGDMHDYMSLAIYYWPNPDKPDGLPYVRRDGQINPEVETYKDKSNISNMMRDVSQLSLAYYFSDDTKYSKRAIEQLRAWFLNPKTKMNPNFNFAQAIKGQNDGRGIGIIECRDLIKVIDAIGLIESDPSWTKQDQQQIQQWFSDFLQWFMTSKNGIDEMKTKNNHGIWYDAQKLSYAIFTNNHEIALSTINSIKERLELQMDSTGFFPAELERTISLHYSAFIIEPLFLIAQMSEHLKVDLWNYTSSTGKSIKKGFEVLAPYLSQDKPWFAEQIKPFEFESNATPLLAQGFEKYNCETCIQGINKINPKTADEVLSHLTSIID